MIPIMLRTCFPDLTQRESEVLGEAILGEGYQEIASTLGIRPTTARNYLQRILSKLGAHSQAVLKAALALVTPGIARGEVPGRHAALELIRPYSCQLLPK